MFERLKYDDEQRLNQRMRPLQICTGATGIPIPNPTGAKKLAENLESG